MIILITGATHTGKTLLAQRLLEAYHYPYLSVDHLKMGLIRSGNTQLTAFEDEALTAYLWPIIREMIKTAMENRQNLIVEGCYIPFDWRRDFTDDELSQMQYICLVMSEAYIEAHFAEMKAHSSDIEHRMDDSEYTKELLLSENRIFRDGCAKHGLSPTLIERDYKEAVAAIQRRVTHLLRDCGENASQV